MNLNDVLDKIREDNRTAFIGYYPVGFPTTDKSIGNTRAIVDAGADIIEVGLPFSGPMMDGPAIQDVTDVTLNAGLRTRGIIRVAREVTERGGTCVIMSYWNPIPQHGPERFAGGLAAAGDRDTTVLDLIPEEVGQWQRVAKASGLSSIMLVAPSSTNERLQLAATASAGFVYATNHTGVTDVQANIDSAADKLVARTREITDIPVCVGLGVSNGEQAVEIAELADDVIVGSALTKAAMKSTDDLVTLAHELTVNVRGES